VRASSLIATTIAIAASIFTAIGAEVAHAQTSPVPILVELFTSEGCSSCPPADAWLQQLDSSQPIPGAQLIVLSEHVDYWDHAGWKDPYSSSLFTDRQQDYVRAMSLSGPYTPQLVVDGKAELHLDQPDQVRRTLLAASKSAPVQVTIAPVRVSGGSAAALQTHIEVDGTSARRSADIYAAIALDHAESQVLHGENGGRRLSHTAVVHDLIKVGRLEKGKTFNRDFQTKLGAAMSAKNLRLVVFVQEPDAGSVVGAAMQKIQDNGK
jgi:hypothetical protein